MCGCAYTFASSRLLLLQAIDGQQNEFECEAAVQQQSVAAADQRTLDIFVGKTPHSSSPTLLQPRPASAAVGRQKQQLQQPKAHKLPLRQTQLQPRQLPQQARSLDHNGAVAPSGGRYSVAGRSSKPGAHRPVHTLARCTPPASSHRLRA